ncbi:MAG TPA: ATP-dependent DNA helicase RecG [Candidatus Acidoferrales bacterium]|jgi:ATP-dependent DNA helicase RecG|nr:ATP-dependent DNA helicase RecG [Candidatus Acidoferrales bacterium]
MPTKLTDSVKFLRGVGPQRAAILEEHGISTVSDLLNYLPFRYEDRIRFTKIAEIIPGQVHTILGEVAPGGGGTVRFMRGRSSVFHVSVRDGSGVLHARFFHGGYMAGRLKEGQKLVLHGKADRDPYRPGWIEMVNPQVEVVTASDGAAADSSEVGRIVPIYEAMGGISSRMLRRIIYQTLSNFSGDIPDPLPAHIRERLRLPARREALLYSHFPPKDTNLELLNSFRSPAHMRLIFEEFFFYQFGMAMRQQKGNRRQGVAMRIREPRIREALKRILPFKPTSAQKRVLGEIAADLERPFPMHRLLEGDVGSGKTIVALEAATVVIENGYQVALMAPTEILAAQHYLSARRIFEPAGYKVELVVGGRAKPEKENAIEQVRSGKVQLVVGTHALIEDAVKFARLGLVIIDEQHRFGVLQRKRLADKGVAPHVLVMTATPIPRTLALTIYGDLDLSVIDELPPGRTPIETRWVSEGQLGGVWEFARREIANGRQIYVLYPVIEESKLELKAATEEYERLAKSVFPKLRVGLLHGRLKNAEKDAVMEQFRRNEIQVLVATTVIEVGVDVPNATVMVIEHADRFGLSQLHQLRGRIGRGHEKSHCMLVAPKSITGEGRERIEAMVATSNGFEIAERDLQQRGPGEFFGTRQHGDAAFSFAQPLRDHELLELARYEAFALAENTERSKQLLQELETFSPTWQKRYHLALVG